MYFRVGKKPINRSNITLMELNNIYQGDSLELLKQLPDNSQFGPG
jgi:DNA modification methylase